MAPGAPRGKRKVVRGRGRDFSRNLRPLDQEEGTGEPEGMWAEPREPKVESFDEDEESSEEDEDDDKDKPELTREERRTAAKARKEAALARKTVSAPASGDLPSDSEHEDELETKVTKPTSRIAVSNPNDPNAAGFVDSTLSRKEREAVEAAAAKERYWKLQKQGMTDQARADMARLAIIRQEREEKAKQRQAELEEKKAAAAAKVLASGRKK